MHPVQDTSNVQLSKTPLSPRQKDTPEETSSNDNDNPLPTTDTCKDDGEPEASMRDDDGDGDDDGSVKEAAASSQ